MFLQHARIYQNLCFALFELKYEKCNKQVSSNVCHALFGVYALTGTWSRFGQCLQIIFFYFYSLQIFSNALSLLNDNIPEHRKRSLLHNELGKIYYAFNDVQTIVNKYKIS